MKTDFPTDKDELVEYFQSEFRSIEFISAGPTLAGNSIQVRFRLGPSKRTVRHNFYPDTIKSFKEGKIGFQSHNQLRNVVADFFKPIEDRRIKLRIPFVNRPTLDGIGLGILAKEFDKAVQAAVKVYDSGVLNKTNNRYNRIRWKKFIHQAVVTCLSHGASKEELEEVFKEALVEHVIKS
jgi:hypothetical protein